MVNFDAMTYKKLMEKYPDAECDIRQLQNDKIVATNYNRIFFFCAGMLTMYIIKGVI